MYSPILSVYNSNFIKKTITEVIICTGLVIKTFTEILVEILFLFIEQGFDNNKFSIFVSSDCCLQCPIFIITAIVFHHKLIRNASNKRNKSFNTRSKF